mmetsp:Transcript_101219/g.315444  ORF Transcript_101219/g.315444 Transcript_101219/m.315444 type:complete len:216 (-) Transcript_101219:147-794(-)
MGHLTATSAVDGDVEAAEDSLRSATFELPPELDAADTSRFSAGMAEVRQVMRQDGLAFDEARLQIVRSRMAQMDVDASGMPNDPKTFTFDQLGGIAPKPWRHASASGGSTAARRCFSSQQAVWDAALTVQPHSEPSPRSARRPGCCEFLRRGLLTEAAKVARPTKSSPRELLLRALALLLLGVLIFVLRSLGGLTRNVLPSFFLQDAVVLTEASP